MNRRPAAVTQGHLDDRWAIGYLRQSTEYQVLHNFGSTELQRELGLRLEDWGWPRERIELIDDDLGASGSNPGSRAGFARLLDRMRTGEVGVVAVTQESRLARNLVD